MSGAIPKATDFPPLYRAADEAARGYQRRFLIATTVQLAGLVMASFAGAVSTPLGVALALTIATFARIYLLSTHPERGWYEARAIAESTKSLGWRYAVAGDPFSLGSVDTEATLNRRLVRIAGLAKTALLGGKLDGPTITPWMRGVRAESIDARREAYRDGRVMSQQAWYSGRASQNGVSATRLMLLMIGLQAAALLTAIASATSSFATLFAGTVASASAAVALWLQVRQHETLATSYALTAVELGGVLASLEGDIDEAAWARLVDEAEEAMSREHTTWQASRFDPR